MRVLNKTVVAGGVVYPAGTPATDELEDLVLDPAHWTHVYEPPPEPELVAPDLVEPAASEPAAADPDAALVVPTEGIFDWIEAAENEDVLADRVVAVRDAYGTEGYEHLDEQFLANFHDEYDGYLPPAPGGDPAVEAQG